MAGILGLPLPRSSISIYSAAELLKGGIMLFRGLALLILASSFSAQARINNFRDVEVNGFSCSEAFRGVKTIKAVNFIGDAGENGIISVVSTSTPNSKDYKETIYNVEDVFPMLGTQMYLAFPADGSEGSLQVLLRDEMATTVSVDATGVSYVECDIML